MGRHSAPETDEERPEPAAVPAASAPPAAPPAASAPAESAPAESAPAESAPTTRVPTPASATAAGARGDLQLLRADIGLLLWCAGSVVLLFLVYTSVLILIGRTDVYLIWLWVPTVLSGMAIGGLLDRAHRAVAERDRPAP